MKKLRLNLQMHSVVSGSITSNTLFGLFCEAYKILNSEEDLECLLDMLYENEEEVVFSNPLKENTFEAIDFSALQKYDKAINVINRNNNTSNGIELEQNYKVKSFDVLLYTTLEIEEVNKLVDIMQVLGIGSGKNRGKGHIKSISISEEKDKELGKVVTLLSDTLPSENTSTTGEFEFTTRYGITGAGKIQNVLILIKANSKMLNQYNSEITGRVFKDTKTNTYVNGKSICV